jgi:hypothetical protein
MTDVGDKRTVKLEVRNEAGELADATEVELEIEQPDGSTETLKLSAEEITKASTGVYTAEISLSENGLWQLTWTTTGIVVVEHQTIFVPEVRYAYAAIADVQRRNFGRTISATAADGTTEDVIQYLEETAGVIDGILRSQGYSVPVSPTTASAAYKTLQGINAIGAWALWESAARTSDRREEAVRMWEQAQDMLRKGEVELDIPIDVSEAAPRSGFEGVATPWFTRDVQL